MSIEYDFYDVTEINGGKSEKTMRVRAVSKRTITTDELLSWIQERSGFSVGEAKGMMVSITQGILSYLGQGYDVQFDDLGYFSVSLTSRKLKRRNEIRGESVEFSKVNFRASKKTREYFKYVPKTKTPFPRKPMVKMEIEKKKQKLKKFLETHPFATRADYSTLTKALRHEAILDLKAFIEEGWLKKYGRGRNVVYILNKEQFNQL